ncbi:MAG: tetratricopeptide repeat protein [Acetobacteraceae bacterium]|nr:tetratricopeptide repeat protein [Acetobacteraceae bacterium]
MSTTPFEEARALHRSGQLAEAERRYAALLRKTPDHAEALHLLGVIALQTGRAERGVELGQRGQAAEALASFERAIALAPGFAAAHNSRGLALNELGRLQDALAAFDRAIAPQPGMADAHLNQGAVLAALGRPEEALASFDAALARDPGLAEAACGRGNALGQLSRHEEAAASFRQALALRPDDIDALKGLGNALKDLLRPEEAVACFRRAVALQPEDAEARLDLALAHLPIAVDTAEASRAAAGQFAAALAELEQWSEAHLAELGQVVGRGWPFWLAYRPGNMQALLSRHGDLMSRAATAARGRHCGFAAAPPPQRGRIRLAVVSGHIRRHSVWDVILKGIVEGLDRRRFELFLYHTCPEADGETGWARRHAEKFVQGPLTVPAWLDLIGQDRPDILLYPEIGMDRIPALLASLRLAPLQVAAWGHPLTSGLPTMDLFLSGELLEGPEAQAHYREKLVRLPGTGVRTRMPGIAAEPVRADALGLPADRGIVRFALSQTAYKFDPIHDALFVEVARAAAPCQIWLPRMPVHRRATESLLDRLGRGLRAAGMQPEAVLRIMPWLPAAQFLGFLGEMDVYLDGPGFSGYTTAWQAVHQGLPIVTLEGEFLRQRLAAGLLRQIGRADTIAATPAEYVAIASRLAAEARDPQRRQSRRDSLRRAAAALADGDDRVLRALEDCLSAELAARRAAQARAG